MKHLLLLLFVPLVAAAQQSHPSDISRWQAHAAHVTIIRDNYGIPHIYGKTDADAVFGLLYAQCEDDFKRVEMNYIDKLGRLSEVNGEKDLYADLLTRLIIDTSEAKEDYKNSPAWLHQLMDAFADGVNYYLYKHPNTKPALLHHFEPWYALLWTDGSIGAISTAGLGKKDLKEFYGNDDGMASINQHTSFDDDNINTGEERLTGSNGFAFSPSITQNGNAILYLNPHVTLYFRPEVHIVSEEGLDVYGVVTWGQFFLYQGFNKHCGWMHTSSYVDVSDSYKEKVSKIGGKWVYEYEHQSKPITQKSITISYKKGEGMKTKTITAYYTHHGPIMGKQDGDWLSVRSYNRSMISLEQSWLRTKANDFEAFKKVLDLRANTSNNTFYADDKGNIAYWHGNHVPIRDAKYDWNKPVDGTTAATEWKGLHKVDELIHLENPTNGWLQNCNSTPFAVAGDNSPKRSDYPVYMAPDGQNFRGVNAVRVLPLEKKYTLDKVIAAGYDTYLSFFEKVVPVLIKAYNALPDDSTKASLAEPISVLKAWDYRSGEHSVGTSLGVTWGTQLLPFINNKEELETYDDIVTKTEKFAAKPANGAVMLAQFKEAINNLTNNYGKWNIEWGEINRFQRFDDDIDLHYDDSKPSIPMGLASSQWGQIPSYTSKAFPGTKKRYGVNGNSFICAVEFGKKITAKSLLAGGESGDPSSPHFTDQAEMYTKGRFKDVLFYKEDVLKHAERTYHPGE